ncbi:MAG: DUF5995 family protein [Actinomycetota bacterium]
MPLGDPSAAGSKPNVPTVGQVIARMEEMAARLPPNDARRHFHAVYLRTTRAVDEELDGGGFLDPEWLARWGAVFASLYTDAFDAWERGEAPRAWEVPFSTAVERPDLQPLRHAPFGMNVHINFDLPQALIAVISDEESPMSIPEYRAKVRRPREVRSRQCALCTAVSFVAGTGFEPVTSGL